MARKESIQTRHAVALFVCGESLTYAARAYDIGRNTLREALRRRGYLIRRNHRPELPVTTTQEAG